MTPLLNSLLAQASERRRGWAQAALAELPAVEGAGRRLLWALGIAGLLLGDLLERSLLPWTRGHERPPYGFAAVFGFLALAPAGFVVLASLAPPSWQPLLFAPFRPILASPAATAFVAALVPLVVLGGLIAAAWVNFGVVFASRHLGGLTYELGVRLKPWNIAVVALSVAVPLLLLRRLLGLA